MELDMVADMEVVDKVAHKVDDMVSEKQNWHQHQHPELRE